MHVLPNTLYSLNTVLSHNDKGLAVKQTTPPSSVKLFDPATLIEPYDAYEILRSEVPVAFIEELNIHVVTRYDLLREAIRDTKTYSSKFDGFLNESRRIAFESATPEVRGKLLELQAEMVELPPTMLTLDEPEHTKYRSLVSKLFTNAQIKNAEPNVQAVIDEKIANFSAANTAHSVEFVSAFAGSVPLTIIADRLGIPAESRAFFDDAATAAASELRLTPLPGEEMIRRAQLAVDLQKLCIELIEARRREPRDDMITILANSKLEDENRYLTHGECISVLNQFLVAGHETTASAFSWGMLLLCQNPELQTQLTDNPALTRTFVEEVLRLESPVQGLPRLVTQDTELGGYPLKAGSLIMLRYGAANRDEQQFERPNEVNLERSKAGSQLAFGAGVHFCVGAPLARQELTLGFPALLRLAHDYELDPGHPPPLAEASFILRNLPELHIRWNQSSR